MLMLLNNQINKPSKETSNIAVPARLAHALTSSIRLARQTGLLFSTLLLKTRGVDVWRSAILLKGYGHDRQASLCSNDIGSRRGINSDLSLLPEREEIGLASLPEFSSLNGINNKLTHYAKVVKEKIHKG